MWNIVCRLMRILEASLSEQQNWTDTGGYVNATCIDPIQVTGKRNFSGFWCDSSRIERPFFTTLNEKRKDRTRQNKHAIWKTAAQTNPQQQIHQFQALTNCYSAEFEDWMAFSIPGKVFDDLSKPVMPLGSTLHWNSTKHKLVRNSVHVQQFESVHQDIQELKKV